jgi:hypothetical protein
MLTLLSWLVLNLLGGFIPGIKPFEGAMQQQHGNLSFQ